MKLEQLRYFMTLARSSSFSDAARKLYLSQQGLNKAVTALERELGAKLIERTHEGVRLTEQGAVYLEYAERISHLQDEAVSRLSRRNGLEASAVPLFATPYALSCLSECFDTHMLTVVREVTYDILIEQARDQAIRNDQGKSVPGSLFALDVFCEEGSFVCPLPQHVFLPVFETKIGLVVLKDDSLAKERAVSLSDVAGMSIALVRNETIDEIVSRLFPTSGLPNVVLRTTNVGLLYQWISERRAVGLLDSFAFVMASRRNFASRNFAFVPLDTKVIDIAGLMFRAGASNECELRAAADEVMRVFKEKNVLYHQAGLKTS